MFFFVLQVVWKLMVKYANLNILSYSFSISYNVIWWKNEWEISNFDLEKKHVPLNIIL